MKKRNSFNTPTSREVEKLYQLCCTDQEVAGFFDVHVQTVLLWKKEEWYRVSMERGKSKGRLSLRRRQMELALDGDVRLLIWLGKNLLGQSEKIEQQIEDTTPQRITREIIDAQPQNTNTQMVTTLTEES